MWITDSHIRSSQKCFWVRQINEFRQQGNVKTQKNGKQNRAGGTVRSGVTETWRAVRNMGSLAQHSHWWFTVCFAQEVPFHWVSHFPTCKLEEVDSMQAHSLSLRLRGHTGVTGSDPIATVSNHYKFSGFKQHRCMILKSWRSEILKWVIRIPKARGKFVPCLF